MNRTPIEWSEETLKSAGYSFDGMENETQWVISPAGERIALLTDGDGYWREFPEVTK